MQKIIGHHHSSLLAKTRAELDRGIDLWQKKFVEELARHREAPEGVSIDLGDCCGPRSVIHRPCWLPTPEPPAELLSFRFLTERQPPDDRGFAAHLCAELLLGHLPAD